MKKLLLLCAAIIISFCQGCVTFQSNAKVYGTVDGTPSYEISVSLVDTR